MMDLGSNGNGGSGSGRDLNLNLSPPSTPRLGLALGLGVGPTSPEEDEIFNHEGEGSIPGRVWPWLSGEEIGRCRPRHRWRGQFRRSNPVSTPSESFPPLLILSEMAHESFKENPCTLKGTAKQDEGNASNFECNICLEMARDPVVTTCGHLFCWACIYQWLYVHSASRECPVCKGEVTDTNIIPIYGRGNSDHAANESNIAENGEKIPPRPRANRIESLRQRGFGRPISRRFMEAIRLTRRRDAHGDNGGARQDEPPPGIENFMAEFMHFHRQTANSQRTRSGEERWQMRQVLARRSLLRPTPTAHSALDFDDRREGERDRIWGLRLNRASSERLASLRDRVEGSLANNFDINDQGVRSGVSDSSRERASISSTNAMILPGSRNGDAVVEQDSGRSSSPQRRRHVPSGSLDSDGGLLNARKRRRLN